MKSLASMFQGLKLPTTPENRLSLGRFYSFDFNAPHEDAKPILCSNCHSTFPEYGTTAFGPHGIGVLEDEGTQVNVQRIAFLFLLVFDRCG